MGVSIFSVGAPRRVAAELTCAGECPLLANAGVSTPQVCSFRTQTSLPVKSASYLEYIHYENSTEFWSYFKIFL